MEGRVVPGAVDLLLGELAQLVEAPRVARHEQLVAQHRHQRRRHRERDAERDVLVGGPVEDPQQRQVGLGDGLVEPVLLQEVLVLRVAHEGEVGVQVERDVAENVLGGHLRAPSRPGRGPRTGELGPPLGRDGPPGPMPPALPLQTRPEKRDQSESRASSARASSEKGPPGDELAPASSHSGTVPGDAHEAVVDDRRRAERRQHRSRSRGGAAAAPARRDRRRGSRRGRRARARGRGRRSHATRARSRWRGAARTRRSAFRTKIHSCGAAVLEAAEGLLHGVPGVVPVEEEGVGIARQGEQDVVAVAPGQVAEPLVPFRCGRRRRRAPFLGGLGHGVRCVADRLLAAHARDEVPLRIEPGGRRDRRLRLPGDASSLGGGLRLRGGAGDLPGLLTGGLAGRARGALPGGGRGLQGRDEILLGLQTRVARPEDLAGELAQASTVIFL